MRKITLLILLVVGTMAIKAQFGGGSGTESDPFEIKTATHLDNVRYYRASHFVLTDDIDLTDFINSVYPNVGWEPIGTELIPFIGSLKGGCHKIKGLWINRPDEDNVGLFGVMHTAKVKGLGVIGSTSKPIIGRDNVGILAGTYKKASPARSSIDIEECFVLAYELTGRENTGGLVGSAEYANIYYSSSRVIVTGDHYVGGLIGQANGTNINYSYAQGSVYALKNNCPGGCYEEGRGWIGSAGGLVGGAPSGFSMLYSYAACKMVNWSKNESPERIGGLFGWANHSTGGFLSTNTYDKELSGINPYTLNPVLCSGTANGYLCGTAYNTSEMKNVDYLRRSGWGEFQYTYPNMNAFINIIPLYNPTYNCVPPNLPYIWGIVQNTTYPFLFNEVAYGNEIVQFQNFMEGGCFLIGNGTASNPYEIRNADELECLRNYLGSIGEGVYFRLSSDIDLSDHIASNYPNGWLPIGTEELPFKGNFDGNLFAIRNLSIDRPGENNIGFFGVLENATVKNLGIINSLPDDDCSYIKGYMNVGMLAGKVIGGQVSHCFAFSICPIEGDNFVGGLIGHNSAEIVNNSSSRVILNGVSSGGLIGKHSSGIVLNNYSQNIIQNQRGVAGGLIAVMESGQVMYNYAASVFPYKGQNYQALILVMVDGTSEVTNCFYGEMSPEGVMSSIGLRVPNFCMKIRDCIHSYTGLEWYSYDAQYNFNPNEPPGCMPYLHKIFDDRWTAIERHSFPFFMHESHYMNLIYCFQLLLESGAIQPPNDFPCYGQYLENPFSIMSSSPGSIVLPQETLSETAPGIVIYPNPTDGIVRLTGENLDIKVYDLKGTLLINTISNVVDLSAYPNGVYIFNINGEEHKVVKQ